MKQKSKHNFNKKIQKEIFVDFTCFEIPKLNSHWIFSSNEFKVNFPRSKFKVGFEAFNLVQGLAL